MGRLRRVGAHLVVLCGTSFSGKSTLAAVLAEALPAVVVSPDAINAERGLYGGQGVPVQEWARTHDIAHQRARAALGEGRAVVVDDTSSPRFLRDAWSELAAACQVPIVLVFLDVTPATALARRDANREAPLRPDVRDAVLHAHLDDFEPPGDDEGALRVTAEQAWSARLVERVRQAVEAAG